MFSTFSRARVFPPRLQAAFSALGVEGAVIDQDGGTWQLTSDPDGYHMTAACLDNEKIFFIVNSLVEFPCHRVPDILVRFTEDQNRKMEHYDWKLSKPKSSQHFYLFTSCRVGNFSPSLLLDLMKDMYEKAAGFDLFLQKQGFAR